MNADPAATQRGTSNRLLDNLRGRAPRRVGAAGRRRQLGDHGVASLLDMVRTVTGG